MAGPLGLDEDDVIPMEPVTVWGTAEGTEWGAWAGYGSGSRFSDAQPVATDLTAANTRAFSNKTQDARCSSDPAISGSRGTQSESERANRATLMYNAHRAAYGPLPANSTFPVIYGDGASEVWTIRVSVPFPGTVAVYNAHNLMPPGSWDPPSAAQCTAG